MAKDRINFPVDPDVKEALNRYIPWGVQAEVFRALSVQLLAVCKELGPGIVYYIVRGEFNVLTKELKEVRSYVAETRTDGGTS